MKTFKEWLNEGYMDIGHKGSGNIMWVYDEYDDWFDFSITIRWHDVHSDVWGMNDEIDLDDVWKGRYDRHLHIVSVSPPQQHWGKTIRIPVKLRNILMQEFGRDVEFYGGKDVRI